MKEEMGATPEKVTWKVVFHKSEDDWRKGIKIVEECDSFEQARELFMLRSGSHMGPVGIIHPDVHLDLFEHPHLIPPGIKAITDKWDKISMEEGLTYDTCGEFLKEVEEAGYTFDFYLDAHPYGLRPIGVDIDNLTE